MIQDVPGREVTREKEKQQDKLNYINIRAAQLHDECYLANATVKFLSTETAGMDKDGQWAKHLSIKITLTIKTIRMPKWRTNPLESKKYTPWLQVWGFVHLSTGQDSQRNSLKGGDSLSTHTSAQAKSKSAHAQTSNTCINAHEARFVSLLCHTAACWG